MRFRNQKEEEGVYNEIAPMLSRSKKQSAGAVSSQDSMQLKANTMKTFWKLSKGYCHLFYFLHIFPLAQCRDCKGLITICLQCGSTKHIHLSIRTTDDTAEHICNAGEDHYLQLRVNIGSTFAFLLKESYQQWMKTPLLPEELRKRKNLNGPVSVNFDRKTGVGTRDIHLKPDLSLYLIIVLVNSNEM